MPDPGQAAAASSTLWTFLTAGVASIPVWTILTALGAASIPLTVMWVKLRLDQLSARCDAVVKVIDDTSDLALTYWLLGDDRDDPDTSQSEEDAAKAARALRADLLKHEIKIIGAQTMLGIDMARISKELPEASRGEISAEFVNLLSALTGSSFENRDEFAEPENGRTVVTSAAKLVRHIRSARDKVSNPWNLLVFLFKRS